MRYFLLATCTIWAFALAGEVPYWDDECILFDESYGARLPGSTDDCVLWQASSGWKVSQGRVPPRKRSKALAVSAACNEAEAVQLVVSPTHDLSRFMVEAGSLHGPDGTVILTDCVDILRVGYVPVTLPSDRMGSKAPWPDPLPPFRAPIAIKAGTNQPVWVRVRVPRDAMPGDYTGQIRLCAEGYEADVPLLVTVYGFELPEDMTCKCAMGFVESAVFEYQCISDPDQQREVVDRYFANFSEHHVSPYDFAPFDPFAVEWRAAGAEDWPDLPADDRALLEQYPLTPVFDWAAWDRAFERGVTKYHFDSYRLNSFPGLSHLRQFDEDSCEYDLGYTAYFQEIESHLREKGWLDIAFIYNIDEPEPIDYPRVRNTFAQLEQAAPDVKRFLTEEPVPDLYGGPDIWCPLPRLYDHEVAEERRAAGEDFWWYVCTGPKAPYLGLFIDHPGTDMRVWLWQTWKYGISGVLIWRANRWTDSGLFPDQPQNPYADPMSWTDRNGGKSPYGNGDGRLIYPPEEAAEVSKTPLVAGPVDSIRWELIRDGIEDYEYFVILEKLLEEKGGSLSARRRQSFIELLDVPEDITREMTDYTRDPAPLEKHRDRVARAIEELERVGRE